MTGQTQQLCISCQIRERAEEEESEHVCFPQQCLEVGRLGLVRRCLGPSTLVLVMSGVSGGMSVSVVSAVQAVFSQRTLHVEAWPPDVPCRSPNHWNSHIESIYELAGGIWSGGQAWTACRRPSCGSSSDFRKQPSTEFVGCHVGSGMTAEPNGLHPD